MTGTKNLKTSPNFHMTGTGNLKFQAWDSDYKELQIVTKYDQDTAAGNLKIEMIRQTT